MPFLRVSPWPLMATPSSRGRMGWKSGGSYGSTGDENSLETGVSTTPRTVDKPVSRVNLIAAFVFAVGLMTLAYAAGGGMDEKIQSEPNLRKIESSLAKVAQEEKRGFPGFPEKAIPFDLSPTHTHNGKSKKVSSR